MRQFTSYSFVVFCVQTAIREVNCRASLDVFSGSLPFAYPPPGDQPGHLVLSGDVDHCQSCNFFSQSFNYIFGRVFTPGMDEQREAVRAAYAGLREHYPALPEQGQLYFSPKYVFEK